LDHGLLSAELQQQLPPWRHRTKERRMTDDQQPEPLEPVPVTDPTGDAVPEPTVEAPTVAAAAAEPAAPPAPPAHSAGPVAAAPAAGPRRSVTVPLWSLAVVGGILLLGFGFLLGWLVAPGDDDDGAASPASERRELPFGGEFRPFSPDGNGGSGGDRWDDGNGNGGSGSTERGAAYLGVVVQDSDDPAGAEVLRVAPDSPADEAGLEAGDVITKVDDEEVADAAALTQRIGSLDPDDEVSIEYRRDGDEHTAEVELDDRPSLGELVPPTTTPRSTS
jgi:membrane-associated protease RseP (regulator of RpoE activity)